MNKMLEKFYFESFLIAFSAFIGAFLSYFVYWIMEKSNLNFSRKLIYLILIFILTLLLIIIILFGVIYLIGLLNPP